MKPPEILGLLEEAAGTKMYEDKKKKAVATLGKKQVKVDEINKVRRLWVWGWRGDPACCPYRCSLHTRTPDPRSLIPRPPSMHAHTRPHQVLTEDISPALDKLRREKVQYMEWQNATKSLDKLRRFCVAYKYAEAER